MPDSFGGEVVGFEGVFAGEPGHVGVFWVDKEVAVALTNGTCREGRRGMVVSRSW